MTSPQSSPESSPPPFPFPRPERRTHVAVSGPDPRLRGRERGRLLAAARLNGALDTYDRLFALGGITPGAVRDDARRALDAIDAFRPALREQIEGLAEGAAVEPWRIAALNARTEILARSAAVPPGECSTIVSEAGGSPVGVQTWDWHVELGPYWHTLESSGARHRYVGLTEHGIVAKIGVNSAGLALHFNILGHRDDRVGGIPVHVLAALVLEEADGVGHARELIESAPITSSGSFMLFDASGTALLDLSPAGVFEAPRIAEGLHLRTNHFLTETPAAREKTWLYQPDSGERFAFLRDRLTGGRPAPLAGDALLHQLITGPDEPPVTCVPAPTAPLGSRWASLATILLTPATREARILDGTPAEHGTRPWISLRA
ncbi:C45 family autoproteolytic acyltransferase/hydrolase [Streptomyces sp. NPDC004327]|uniref:C45 family autoproteolytic acyltransferase/hydolase n=1 Tax=Streptomyces sp. NPDC004327 TaxID=3364699 RepID=UPI003696EAD4